MAEVFEAELVGAEGFTRRVAVKRLHSGLEAVPRYVAMFLEEASLAARFSHPNVVSVFDFGRGADGRPFIVMEHVDGIDLSRLARSCPLPHSVAIFIASELLSGLGYLHDLPGGDSVPGLVHRDLSPRNVLLSWDGAVKIADFGIAKARKGTVVPASGVVRGTAGYLSPEQVNREALDGRSDLFAVGVILWELLAGSKLFQGTASEMFSQLLFHSLERPSTYRPDIPEDLERIAMRLLAQDRAKRYETAELVLQELALCRDAPPNGRRELARFLAERFPGAAASRARPAGRVSETKALGTHREGVCTVKAPPVQEDTLPDWQRRADALEQALRVRARARWWMWMLGAAFAATALLAFLLAR